MNEQHERVRICIEPSKISLLNSLWKLLQFFYYYYYREHWFNREGFFLSPALVFCKWFFHNIFLKNIHLHYLPLFLRRSLYFLLFDVRLIFLNIYNYEHRSCFWVFQFVSWILNLGLNLYYFYSLSSFQYIFLFCQRNTQTKNTESCFYQCKRHYQGVHIKENRHFFKTTNINAFHHIEFYVTKVFFFRYKAFHLNYIIRSCSYSNIKLILIKIIIENILAEGLTY